MDFIEATLELEDKVRKLGRVSGKHSRRTLVKARKWCEGMGIDLKKERKKVERK